MSLRTWALAQIRAQLPQELIFDGPRAGFTFDGQPADPAKPQCIVVHVLSPSHQLVTEVPTADLARARIIVHSFGATRSEVEARQAAVARALKNRQPVDDTYAWSLIEHPESRDGDPETLLPAARVHGIDVFTVGGFERT